MHRSANIQLHGGGGNIAHAGLPVNGAGDRCEPPCGIAQISNATVVEASGTTIPAFRKIEFPISIANVAVKETSGRSSTNCIR